MDPNVIDFAEGVAFGVAAVRFKFDADPYLAAAGTIQEVEKPLAFRRVFFIMQVVEGYFHLEALCAGACLE